MLIRLLSSLIVFLITSATWAAPNIIIPAQILPGQVQNDLMETIETLTQPASKPSPAAPQPPLIIEPVPASMKYAFTLRDVTITGSTIYSSRHLRSLYLPFLGKRINYKQVEKITSLIKLKYMKDGYLSPYVHISQQNLATGHLILEIHEPYIAKVSVRGKTHGLEKYINAYSEKIKQSRPLQKKVLEHYIFLLNRLPGILATLKLEQFTKDSAAENLVFYIRQRRFLPYANIINNQSPYYGSQNLSAAAEMYSLLQGGDETTLGITTAPTEPNVLRNYYLRHAIPIGFYGKHIDILADYTKTNPNLIGIPTVFSIPIINRIQGNTYSLATYYYHPFILEPSQELQGRLGLTYYDTHSKVYNNPPFIPLMRNTKLRFPSLRAKLIFRQTKPQYTDRLETELSRGLHTLGASTSLTPSIQTPRALTLSYTQLYYYMAHTQRLFKDCSLLIDSQGQYSFDSLLGVEKIGYGGTRFGRAYAPSEIVGDSGIMAGTELRYNFRVFKLLDTIQYFMRYDIGKVWDKNHNVDFEINSISSDASLSMGFRLLLLKNFKLEFGAARPMTNPIQERVLSNQNGKSLVFFGNVSYIP